MKRILSFVSAAAVTVTSVSLFTVSAQTDETASKISLEYELVAGSAYITGYTGSDPILIIPSQIDGKNVAGIRENTFMGAEELTAVVIPDTVTSVGDKAFSACPSLTTVTLGSGVSNIGDMAFSACPSLQSFFVSKDNKTYTVIKGSLFEKNELVTYAGGSNAEIPSGTVSVRKGAFMGKTEIVSVDFPSNGLTSLGDYAFSGCTSLKKAVMPVSVKNIGTGCFASCYNLNEVFISPGCTAVKDGTFRGCSSLFNINIPSSVTEIGDSAFLGCSMLSGMYIPPTVKKIGDNAVGRSYSIRDGSVETTSGFEIHAEKDSAGAKYAESLNIPAKPFLSGDLNDNGIIEGSDASMALRLYTESSSGLDSTFSAYQAAAADWNRDDIITGSDATLILRKYTELSSGME